MKKAVKRLLVSASIVLGFTVVMLAQPTYNISTVMGSYNLADNSSGSPLGNPQAVAVDSSGKVYFTDTMGNRVRVYDPTTNTVTTIAGDGTFGANGQNAGGPATKAKLWQPSGVAVDSKGNVYIADSFDAVILKVDTTGVATIFAGESNNQAYTGDGGLATSARLRNPNRISVDANGVLYIADKENNRIRKVGTDGIIRTVAGFGGDSTTTPHAFSGDAGTLGTACTANQGSATVNPNLPCPGFAVQAGLGQPQAAVADSYGNVYLADTANNRIRMVSKTDALGSPLLDSKGNKLTDSTAIITTIVGGGSTAQLSGTCTSTCANGAAGIGASTPNAGFNSNPLAVTLSAPGGLAIDANNNLYISDSLNNRILFLNFNRNTGCTQPAAQGCAQTSPLLSLILNLPAGTIPEGIAISGNELYIAASGTNRILQFDLPTQTTTTLVASQSNPFVAPRGLAIDASSNIWVADTFNNRINTISQTNGVQTRVGGTGTAGFPTAGGDNNPEVPVMAINSRVSAPWGGAFDASGNFYFADRGNNRVRMITPGGVITTVAGGNNPAIPATGFTKPATFSTAAGYSGDGLPAVQGQLRNPAAVAVDSVGGNSNCTTAPCIYIVDSGNDAIRKVDAFGIMTTFAGLQPPCAVGNPLVTGTCSGVAGGSGDGLLATQAQLNIPLGIAVDTKGNVYIADTSNHSIREVSATTGYITTIAGVLTSEGRGGDAILAVNSTGDYPVAVAVDSTGNVYWAEGCTNIGQNTIFTDTLQSNGFNRWGTCETSRIRRLDVTTGMVATLTAGAATAALGTGIFGGDGAKSTASLALYPTAIAVDSTGNVYFADSSNRVRKLTVVPPSK